MKLTPDHIALLNDGCSHRDGVIRPRLAKSNFDKPERRIATLVDAGLAVPNPHGDWYITDAGRKILEAGRAHIAMLARADGEHTFASEVEAGAWDHRDDVSAAISRAAASCNPPQKAA